ncbi:MAG: endonuclease/exonuclease/phosphatase family protein [Deltaproteobacteria bacterium]|nr:endonuclease/exonuclease/phosphatase family protein [Deltaproteobacteria bacterium]
MSPPPDRPLRVATLNVWNRSGPWERRRELIRSEIRALDLDVLGLQEVLRVVPEGTSPDGVWEVPDVVADDGAADQASLLVAGALRHAAYSRAADYGGGLAFGNAVASRYPIVEHRSFELPGRETGETRSLLFARIAHPAGELPFFVTHLNWKLHHGSVRVEQVRFVMARMAELAPVGGPGLPPVLVGDFNAEPDSDEIRWLRGLATLGGRSVFLSDAWIHAGDGSPGYTFDRANPFAALAHEPPRRIDYLFVRGPDSQLRGEPLRARLAFCTPEPGTEGPVYPSDHFGVTAELALAPRSWG